MRALHQAAPRRAVRRAQELILLFLGAAVALRRVERRDSRPPAGLHLQASIVLARARRPAAAAACLETAGREERGGEGAVCAKGEQRRRSVWARGTHGDEGGEARDLSGAGGDGQAV